MRNRILAFSVIASVIAAACGGGATTASPSPAANGAAATTAAPTNEPPAKLSIMVGGLNKQIYLPNKLTEALGYFKEQNLDVTLVDEPSGVDTENAVAAGQVQLGSGSYDHTIDLQVAGKDLTCVLVMLQEPGEAVLVSTKKADTIKSPADWKGKNVGVTSLGSGTHTLTRYLAVHNGLKVEDVTFVKAGAGDTMIAAFKQGTIDVGITTQPTVLRLINSGDAKMLVNLFTPESTRAAMGGDYPFISLWGKTDYVQKNKAVVQRVVNAYVKTLKWIQTHSPAEITDKLPADYSTADKPGYIQALTDSMKMFSPDGKMPKGAPEFVLNVLKQFNTKVQSATVDLAKTYTSEFVDNAK